MAAWHKQAARDYDWACAGGTAEMAVWLQLLEQESLQPAEGPEAEAIISTLLDLAKCFEKKGPAASRVDVGPVLESASQVVENDLPHVLHGKKDPVQEFLQLSGLYGDGHRTWLSVRHCHAAYGLALPV